MSTKSTVRYSAEDLAEFKAVILKKLESAKAQFESLQSQINEIAESSEDEHGTDMMDDSSVTSGVELLSTMANRQRSYMRELNNALSRIKNGVYGICAKTGQLIDKRRLLLVPTTMKSVEAKIPQNTRAVKKTPPKPLQKPKPKAKTKTEPKIITKVIRRTKLNGDPIKPIIKDDYLDDEDEDDELSDLVGGIDPANYEGEEDYEDGDETPRNIIKTEEDEDDFDF